VATAAWQAGGGAAQRNLASQGRFFCKLRSVGLIHPQHPQHTYRDPLLRSIGSGQRRINRSIRKTIPEGASNP